MSLKITNFLAIALISISFFIAQSSQSQILISLLLGDKLNSGNLEFGLDGGFNRSYLSGVDNAKGFNNFNLGFYFDFRIMNNWYVNTGVRVKSNLGATNISPYILGDEDLDSVMTDGHVTRKISYFHVPLHIKYRFVKQFYVMGGVQAGLRSKAKDLFYSTFRDKDDTEVSIDIRDQVKRLDFGMSGGVGYKFKGTGMNLGITYYYGLVDIMKDSNIDSKNSSFYIYVDIPIGAGYKENKKEKKEKE